MRTSFSELARITLLVALVLGLTSCSKGDGSRILGHWRAERVKLMSLNLPIGPEFMITKHELLALETDIHIPIESISEKGDEFVVNIPAGLGLSFYFEGPDRMYLDVPLAGKIYYQRVEDIQKVAKTAPASAPTLTPPLDASVKPAKPNVQPELAAASDRLTPVATGSAVPTVGALDLVRQAIGKMEGDHLAEAQVLLLQARGQEGEHPMVDYNLAILRARQGDNEAAIRHLNDAFRHGFRAFSLLDSSPDLAPLKSDVRYDALVSRYK